MKKILCALCASASLMLAGAAHAGVIHFDDVNTDGDFASLGDLNPYADLTWSEDWFAGDTDIGGYANAAYSGTKYAVNAYGNDGLLISSASGFDFAGAWFATPERAAVKASWINISAYDALNQFIGSTGNVSISDSYQWVDAAFQNVSTLTIARDNGWFVMDDFTTTDPAQVPEPGTALMVAIGLFALGAGRRSRRSAGAGASRAA